METGINPNLITPLVHVCIDDTGFAGTRPCCPAHFAAPMLDTGSATVNKAYLIGSYNHAEELFGVGSIAADMAKYYFANNGFGELFITGMEEPTGAKSTATITITGNVNRSGTVSLRVNDEEYYVGTVTGDTAASVIADIVTEINDDPDSLVTAAATGGVITLTAKQVGLQGNTMSVSLNSLFGEETPAGLTISLTPFEGGSGTYELEDVYEELGNCCYDLFGIPFQDTASLNIINAEVESRFDCSRLIGGHWVAAKRASFSDAIAFLDATEYPHGQVPISCPEEPWPIWRITAAWVGRAHNILCSNVTRSWYNGLLTGLNCSQAKCQEACFPLTERNLLALRGGATMKCADNGIMVIENDVSATEVTVNNPRKYPQTYFTTIKFVRDLKVFVESNFGTSQIVENLEFVPDGSSAVSIPVIVSEIQNWAITTQGNLIDNAGDLGDFIKIDRSRDNPYRIDMIINIDLINAIRMFAIKVRPNLQILT